jgi:hypothetical protein
MYSPRPHRRRLMSDVSMRHATNLTHTKRTPR